MDRCLIVDDEPFNIDSLKITLQCATADKPNFNFAGRIDTASNGHNAFELVKQKYKEGMTYKFIMMDCNMPKMDGYQATSLIIKFLEDNGHALPVIVAVSGHVEQKYIYRAFKAGMNHLIAKPASVDDVHQIIKHI